MSNTTRRGFLIIPLVLAVVSCRQSIDPAAAGTWHVQGVGLYWEIRSDGTYAITQPDGTLMNAGDIEISDGRWSIQAPNWQDAGNYTITGDTLSITSRLGPSVWHRVDPGDRQLALMKLSDFGEGEQLQVLAVLQRIAAKVKRWSDDAVLEEVWYQERDYGNRLTFSFCSPRTERGYQAILFPDRTHFDEVRPRGWCTDTNHEVFAVPRVFLDLPTAIGIARRDAGLRGRIRAARIRVWVPNAEPILAWVLEGGDRVNVEATTGAVVEGDLTGAEA